MTLLTKREQQELILFNKQRKRIGEPKLTEEEYYRYLYGKGLPAKKVKIAEKPYKGISVPTWAITTSHIPSHVTNSHFKGTDKGDWKVKASSKYTVAPPYNKGGYQVLLPSEIKTAGRKV